MPNEPLLMFGARLWQQELAAFNFSAPLLQELQEHKLVVNGKLDASGLGVYLMYLEPTAYVDFCMQLARVAAQMDVAFLTEMIGGSYSEGEQ